MKNKRGYYFSLDAFIALLIILAIVLTVKPQNLQYTPRVDLQEDLLNSLSVIKVGELDNDYVEGLVSSGKIKNLNQSVLDQIGEFYAESNIYGVNMAQSILDELNPENNIGLYFDNVLIASHNKTSIDNARNVWTARQIISGFPENGTSFRGYSSRAFLSSSSKVDYIYFGGYVGDGNVTIEFDDKITAVKMEAVFGSNFDLYINNIYIGSYVPTPNIPYEIDLGNYLDKFTSGINYIDFKSTPGTLNNFYIAGGFVKINHDESYVLNSTTKKNIPGVKGLINYYDGFYVPGNLNELEVNLHYNSSFDIFMTIGNVTVYRDNSRGDEVSVTLDNTYLSSLLDYDSFDEQTIPLRLGMFNASYVVNQTLNADVYSVTDLSGSMKACQGDDFWCCIATGDNCNSAPTCQSCGGTYENKIGKAKDANREFVNNILNVTGNRVGLVGYKGSFSTNYYHFLSNNNNSLIAEVDSWSASGSTCICCGINKAVTDLVVNSTSSKYRSFVVMSDGEANVQCVQQGTGNAKQDAIQASCDAFNDYGIVIYAVGFGNGADENTLQQIATCGHGSYYYSDVGEITEVYEQIAQEIIDASYVEQTIVAGTIDSTLFSDSYISYDYDKTVPYGLVITAETPEFGNTISEGSLFVPNDTIPYEIRVVSYSGSRWTDKVDVYNSSLGNWTRVYDLSKYGSDYVDLGDPFVVNVPISNLVPENNLVRVSTGLAPGNSSIGSNYDKIIYTLVKDISSFSQIVSSAIGCNWSIEFEDGTNSTIKVPSGYTGSNSCSFTSSASPSYNTNDAIDIAVYKLLKSLDLNGNGKIETKFSNNDLTLSTSEVQGIPFTWDMEVQARVWR